MLWKVMVVLLLVATNGFFVAAEFALVKVRLSEIRVLARSGNRTARTVEHILKRLDAYLSACQLGITLASLGLGWVGEPLVARSLEPLVDALGISRDKVHFVAFPLAFFLITFLHITAGEQAPKILAIQKYRPTALVVGLPLSVFYRIFRPFIWLLNASSNAMLRVIGIRMDAGHSDILTEEQLRLILLESARAGHVTQREHLFMENVLDLEDKPARRYMVPRQRIVYIDRKDSMEDKLRRISESGYTRLPLCNGDLDHIVGIVHIKDIFRVMTSKEEELTALTGVARDPLFLPETIRLDALLREFQHHHTPLAMLIDEYGVVTGMIMLENVIEELVGPIQDEFDSEAPLIVKKGEHQFEVDALCPVDTVVKACQMELPADILADTIGGVVMEVLGHIPRVDEQVTVGVHRITVLKVESIRILRLLIEKLQAEGEAASSVP